MLKKLIHEKIRFLKSKHHSLIEKNNALTQEIKNNKPFSSMNEKFHSRTKMLNEILDKCKTHGDKGGLGYMKLLLMEKLCLSKANMKPLTK